MIKVKSIYTRPHADDGKRFLVELFWPEGIHTFLARVDRWYRELGPSYDLQRFEYETSDWPHYRTLYENEILNDSGQMASLREIQKSAEAETVTLLYGSSDAEQNHAQIVRQLIENKLNENSETKE